MVFHRSLSDSKSPDVSRTLLSILAVLHNVVVWMVSTRPPTSKSSSPFSNLLITVPNATNTIGINFPCMFHFFFFNSLARSSIIIIIYSLRNFHISVSRLFCGVWVIASHLKSPGLFSVFWPFSIMLQFGWSPHVLLFPSPPIPFIILWCLYQKHQPQLV